MNLHFVIFLILISLSYQNTKIGKRNNLRHLNKFHGLNRNKYTVEHPVVDVVINSAKKMKNHELEKFRNVLMTHKLMMSLAIDDHK
jgi:hypothetical protein